MGEMGNLYKTIPVRFSLINEQHINTLHSLEKLCKPAGESRSQIMINAIEMYCRRMEQGEGADGFPVNMKEDIDRYLDGAKERIKNEIRQELMKELINIISGISIPGGAGAAIQGDAGKGREQDSSGQMEDIENDAGIMENALKWG